MLALTMLPLPMTARLRRTIEPMPISEPSPTVQPCSMTRWADGDVGADLHGHALVGMQHRAVLDVAVFADDDRGSLSPRSTAFHQMEAPAPETDVADHGGVGGDPGVGCELRVLVAECEDGHGNSSAGWGTKYHGFMRKRSGFRGGRNYMDGAGRCWQYLLRCLCMAGCCLFGLLGARVRRGASAAFDAHLHYNWEPAPFLPRACTRTVAGRGDCRHPGQQPPQ